MPAANPLLPSPARPLVSVAHGDGPHANTRRALQSIDLAPLRGKRVLLKPNLGRIASPGEGITTHPEVVAVAIDAFRNAGAEVGVGDSPIVGVPFRAAVEASGIGQVADQRDCPVIELDRRPFVKLPVPDGLAIHSLKVCADVLEFDYVVSLPVMKTHMHTGVTLAVKNMKGCLWRRSKVELHMLPPIAASDDKPIDIAIADMSSVLRPQLAIVDGTVGMEGLGPSAGRPKPLDVVVVSADAFAADAVACHLMGMSAADIPHLRIGAGRGYGVVDLARLTVTPNNWQDWVSPFCPPPRNLSIEFPNIVVRDHQSCSACQSTVLLFLKRYQDRIFDFFPSDQPVQIAIGKGNADLPAGTLCIGNCTLPNAEQGIFVRGCPPVGSQILNAIDRNLNDHSAAGDQEPATGDEA